MDVIALVPARNEGTALAETVEALRRQTVPPTRIVAVVNNYTPDTLACALSLGVEVLDFPSIEGKKAGALNAALRILLPQLSSDALVLVQDADSVLDRGFIEGAVSHLSKDTRLGAVGGTFRGAEGGGFVGHLERNEYARYARDVRRLKGKCLVVTGTAALLRVETLRKVSAARLAGTLPSGDGVGGVYDTTVLTEDNELTFALLTLGYTVLSPKECTLVTEVMGNWRDLWQQRLRWKRGAVENCLQYGLTKVTWRYWGRQALTILGVLVTFLYLSTLVVDAIYGFHLQKLWLYVTMIFVVERAVTVRDRGWRHALVSCLMYEVIYDTFLQIVHAKAYLDVVLRKTRVW